MQTPKPVPSIVLYRVTCLNLIRRMRLSRRLLPCKSLLACIAPTSYQLPAASIETLCTRHACSARSRQRAGYLLAEYAASRPTPLNATSRDQSWRRFPSRTARLAIKILAHSHYYPKYTRPHYDTFGPYRPPAPTSRASSASRREDNRVVKCFHRSRSRWWGWPLMDYIGNSSQSTTLHPFGPSYAGATTPRYSPLITARSSSSPPINRS